MIRVCFVCLGNICRSPTAEGIMLHLVRASGLQAQIQIDSAGTAGYHQGEAADGRSRQTAMAHGVDLPSRSRQFVPADFQRFDHVIAMDRENARNLRRIAPDDKATGRVTLLRNFAANGARDLDVPDPYYGGPEGFEQVFDICQAGCEGLLRFLREEHGF